MQEMLEGPVTTITFLGIELDSVHLAACLPADKLARVWQRYLSGGTRRSAQNKILQHVATVVRFGRFFLHQMIALSTTSRELHHHIRLNKEFHSDLQWWTLFVPRWNGSIFLLPVLQAHPDVMVYSAASDSWGYQPILAPGTMATVLVNQEHHWEGDAVYSACSCSVGAGLA